MYAGHLSTFQCIVLNWYAISVGHTGNNGIIVQQDNGIVVQQDNAVSPSLA
jgi:hypothetical protein